MGRDDSLAWRDAVAQAESVRRGELSRRELVAAAIERIERSNPALNAVVTERYQAALDEAQGASGPFAGVPILLKDLTLEVAGEPYHAGTALLKRLGWRSREDGHLAERYRRAGFVVLGRTNSSELGLLTTTEPRSNGPTRNPWHLARSPGGSSGGSAAAVAAGLVPLAHASDAVGSIRIPASACGLVGLKPSRGRVPLGPQPFHDIAGVVTQHVLTRSVRDTAAVLDASAGPIAGERYAVAAPSRRYADELAAAPGPLRIGCLGRPLDARVPFDPGCGDTARDAARVLESLGHRVEEAWPEALADGRALGSLGTLSRVAVAGWLEHMAAATGTAIGPGDVEPFTLESAALGRAVTGVEYASALQALDAHARRLLAWWRDGFDLLLTPTLPIEPWPLAALAPPPERPMAVAKAVAGTVAFTAHFNVSGQPAVSLPFGQSEAGLPLGVQLVAAPGREDLLIRVAAQLERERPWAARRPAPAPRAATS